MSRLALIIFIYGIGMLNSLNPLINMNEPQIIMMIAGNILAIVGFVMALSAGRK